jgi:HSP20 family protein
MLIPDFFNDFDLNEYNGPRVNVSEAESVFEIEFAIPGVTKEEVSISLPERDVLEVTIKGKQKYKSTERKWLRREFSYGKIYKQQFNIPENIDLNRIKAVVENGILTITLPKQKLAEDKPRTIKVQ